MTQMLYVVMGTTGEYSDRSEWPVRAFAAEATAQQFVLMADAWLHSRGVHENSESPVPGIDRYHLSCEFDPKFSCDYTGTRYYIIDVPLDDDLRTEIAETVAQDVASGRLRRGIKLEGDL